MFIPKLAIAHAINGETRSLTVVENPSGWTTERVLWFIVPLRLPAWTIYFLSTHSRKLTLQHLLLKLILQGLNKNEMIVMFNLTIAQKDQEYEILELILSNKTKVSNFQSIVLSELIKYDFLDIVDPLRQLQGFVPRLSIFKVWTEKKRLPPKLVIGVGYNDHGSLSSVPSWKDQMTDDGDVSPRLEVLLFSLRRTFGLPLFRTPPSRVRVRLTSSNKSETGK